MKKQPFLWFFAPLVFLAISMNSLCAQNNKDTTNQAKRQSDLYLRAPDVVPGTLPEMRRTSYWISKMDSPDEVVLSIKEIESRNVAYRKRMANRSVDLDSVLNNRIDKQLKSRPGLLAHIPDIGSMTPYELEGLTKEMVQNITSYLRSREFGNIMSIQYSEDELKEIENEISYKNGKTKLVPQTAVVTRQSRLHVIPPVKPEYIGMFTNGKAGWDLWNLDVLPPGTQVLVLHISKTGAFSFVLSERGYGWVSSEEIGICTPLDSYFFTNTNDFIVCTGDRVPFYADADCTLVSGWMLMGDRLPLIGTDSRSISIPFRNAYGKLSIEKAWLKPDADVQIGYLPYTKKNVAEQAFKLLDNLYDWTGSWYGRNHATNIRDVFRCFGFQLPSNGTLMAAFSERPLSVNPKEGREAQFNAILSNIPFLTIQICENSHSQLFMGDYDGMPVGFDAHGYSYKDKEGNDLEIKRWVVSTIETPDYFLKQEINFVRLY